MGRNYILENFFLKTLCMYVCMYVCMYMCMYVKAIISLGKSDTIEENGGYLELSLEEE